MKTLYMLCMFWKHEFNVKIVNVLENVDFTSILGLVYQVNENG